MQNQILSNFTIGKSSNLSFSKMPGGSFSGMDSSTYDLKQTQILSIQLVEFNKLKVELRNDEGNVQTGYIRAKNNLGIQELNIIASQAKKFINKSYDALIYFSFKKYDAIRLK